MFNQLLKREKSCGSSFTESLKAFAYANPLYNLTLKTKKHLSLNYVPNDLWPGDAEHGMALINNQYHFAGITRTSSVPPWSLEERDLVWEDTLHSFTWLRDLKSVGGDAGRRKARMMITDWIREYGYWNKIAWQPATLARRICAWVYFYNFGGANADEVFKEKFTETLAAQAKHLLRVFPGSLNGVERLQATKALLLTHICLTISSVSEDRIQHLIETEASNQIWQDGMHISRNPIQHTYALMDLIDIRVLLKSADVPVPNSLNSIIDKMAAALKFMRHGDGKLPIFAGSHEASELLLDTVLTNALYKGKPAQSLKQSGYSKKTLGRATLFIDIGPEGPDIKNWKSPGAIEFSMGKQRIFVNCGTTSYPSKYSPHMDRTVAFSTLSLQEKSVDFSNYEQLDLEPRRSHVQEDVDSYLLELSHAGYLKGLETIHHRRIYLSQNGEDLRGEDILSGPAGLEYALRFHLHPSIKASIIQDGYEILLQPAKGAGFRFLAGGHRMTLEESIYFADGETFRKTQQIVLEGQTIPDTTALQWALQREAKA